MKLHSLTVALGALVWAVLCSLSTTCADDWPAYRRDAHRSAVSGETLTIPMTLQWTYRAAQPPRPAWPEPGRALNTLDFDYSFQPVVADGVVYFGSSGDDAVRAVDAATGRLIWLFVTGAPVRLAPQLAAGRLYVASDDGKVYCLDAVRSRNPAEAVKPTCG